MNKWLKPIRVVVSLLFLGLTGFLFLDFTGSISPAWYGRITWIQFVPSLLTFLTVAGIGALGFLVVLIVTLLWGRVYCSLVCPLGILQDVVSFVSRQYREKIRKKRRRYRPAEPWNKLRYTIMGVTIVAFLAGSVFFLNLLDPFSLFGKIFSGLVRPLYFSMNNTLAGWLQEAGIHALYHVETRRMTLLPLIWPALMLGVIVWLSLGKGRLYCNTICPVGSFLGLIATRSMYRIGIDFNLCSRCGDCSLNCKAQCIDLKNNDIDFSRCVGCFNCLNACSKQGIGYRNRWFPDKKTVAPTETAAAGNDNERRTFLFRLAAAMMGTPLATRLVTDRPAAHGRQPATSATNRAAAVKGPAGKAPIDQAPTDNNPTDLRQAGSADELPATTGGSADRPTRIPEQKQFPISPPGSRSLRHFKDTCTACQLCVSACPTRVLQPSFLEYGVTGMMQPRMDFHASFCNFDCVICSEVCPTAAILPLTREQKHTEQIGLVTLILGNCVVKTDNTACGACAEHCPTQAVRMVPYKNGLTIPEIHAEYCVGCGGCEYICPVRPHRAIYIDGLPVHGRAKPPVIEKLDFTPDDDFPF